MPPEQSPLMPIVQDDSYDPLASVHKRAQDEVKSFSESWTPDAFNDLPAVDIRPRPYVATASSCYSTWDKNRDSGYYSNIRSSVDPNIRSRTSVGSDTLALPTTPRRPPGRPRANSNRTVSSCNSITRDRSKAKQRTGQCKVCKATFSTPSEFKKHAQKHDKPNKCNVSTCNKAFATPNDLERHMRSLHKIFPVGAKYWKCAAPGCSDKEKEWPRLDNFKQHLDRMHGDMRLEDLVKASSYTKGQNDRSYQYGLSIHLEHVDDRAYDDASSQGRPEFIRDDDICSSNTQDLMSNADNTYNPPFAGHYSQGHRSATPTDEHSDFGPNEQLYWQARPSLTGTESYDSGYLNPFAAFPSGEDDRAQDFSQMGHADDSYRMSEFMPSDQIPCSPFAATPSPWQGLHNGSVNMYHNHDSNYNQAYSLESTFFNNTSPVRQRSDTQTSLQCPEPECNKTFHRACDLRKHLKRHTRPYGCTHDECTMAFGSKNDWKRHESSRHMQEEMWRCEFPCRSKPGGQCASPHKTQESFSEHLRHTHQVRSLEEMDRISKRCKIGQNFMGSFWCGICVKIVEQKAHDLDAVEDRYDHIARHFSPPQGQEPRSIDKWVMLSTGLKKRGKRSQDSKTLAGNDGGDDEEAEGSPEPDYKYEVGAAGQPGAQVLADKMKEESPRATWPMMNAGFQTSTSG